MQQQLDIDYAHPAILAARNNADILSEEFLIWLPDNLHIWDAFAEEAFNVIRRGYQHYSSYTIVEFIRHHSALAESGSIYKINNTHRPYLARLFAAMHPQHRELFEFRVTTKKKGA